jgi:hypothetical protein
MTCLETERPQPQGQRTMRQEQQQVMEPQAPEIEGPQMKVKD